jgi:hypothetical protein
MNDDKDIPIYIEDHDVQQRVAPPATKEEKRTMSVVTEPRGLLYRTRVLSLL